MRHAKPPPFLVLMTMVPSCCFFQVTNQHSSFNIKSNGGRWTGSGTAKKAAGVRPTIGANHKVQRKESDEDEMPGTCKSLPLKRGLEIRPPLNLPSLLSPFSTLPRRRIGSKTVNRRKPPCSAFHTTVASFVAYVRTYPNKISSL